MSDTNRKLRVNEFGQVLPQMYNPAADAYQTVTGADLGSGRRGLDNLMWGKTAGGVYAPVAIDPDGSVNVKQTGSNALYEDRDIVAGGPPTILAGATYKSPYYATSNFYETIIQANLSANVSNEILIVLSANSSASGLAKKISEGTVTGTDNYGKFTGLPYGYYGIHVKNSGAIDVTLARLYERRYKKYA